MQKSKGKLYALMAGVCFGIYGLCYLIHYILHEYDVKYVKAVAYFVVTLLPMIGMSAALFLKNEKAVIAAAGAGALSSLCLTVYLSSSMRYSLYFLVYALIAALILMTRNNRAVAQKIWFIPGTAVLLHYLLSEGGGRFR